MSVILSIVGVLVVVTNIIAQVMKKATWDKIPTNCLVIAISMVLTLATFFAYCEIKSIAVVWYMVVGAIVLGFWLRMRPCLALTSSGKPWVRSARSRAHLGKIMCERHNIAFTENLYNLNIDEKSEHVADLVFNISDYTTFLDEKDAIWNAIMETCSIPIFDDAIRFLRTLKELGFKCCVVSASRNAGKVVQKSKLSEYIDLVIDGNNRPLAVINKSK